MANKQELTRREIKGKTEATPLAVRMVEGEKEDAAVARTAAGPDVGAALTMSAFTPMKQWLDVNAMRDELEKQAKEVGNGDMSRPKAILTAQAHTLDVMFNSLAQIACKNMNAGYLQATEAYMRMALKAQSQCRTTVEALAEIKFPKHATFIKQQNVAHQQQVNNGQQRADEHPRAHEKDITPSNELL